MNPVQDKIQAAVAEAAWGRMALPTESFYCLKAVRLILEKAFGWSDMELYGRLMTRPKPARSWYASDFEQAMRDRGFVAPEGSKPQPGDVVFGAQPEPQGHVGIVFRGADGNLWVIENVMVQRQGARRIRGANFVVPLRHWDRITTLGRFPAGFLDTKAPAAPVAVPATPTATPAPAPEPAATPKPAGPVITPVVGRDERRVMLDTDGSGQYQDITGQRIEVSKIGSVVINAKGDTVWIRAQ